MVYWNSNQAEGFTELRSVETLRFDEIADTVTSGNVERCFFVL